MRKDSNPRECVCAMYVCVKYKKTNLNYKNKILQNKNIKKIAKKKICLQQHAHMLQKKKIVSALFAYEKLMLCVVAHKLIFARPRDS